MRSRELMVSISVLLVVLLAGCEKETWKPNESDRRQIVVDGAKMTLHTGIVGTGNFEKAATYALVDATNPTMSPLSVTLSGTFLDTNSQVVGTAIRQSLRIPAKATRTFALVNQDRTATPGVTGATIEVTSAVRLDYEELMEITDLHEYKDEDRIVVKAYVNNKVARIGKVVVFATFYDAEGRPIKRPSTLFRLERHARRGVQFVGPSGSVRATMSVGDIVY